MVTPTLGRPDEVRDLLTDLAAQTVLPTELILVDGAGPEDGRTQRVVHERSHELPYPVRYLRRSGGTAIQRNHGIDQAKGEHIAFIDDDIRLSTDFFARMLEAYCKDVDGRVGGITGYITNQHLDPTKSRRWRWYRRLRLFSTYEPGRYDWATGYPINRYLRPPHETLVEIDFMGAGCAVWRREVFDTGLRFSRFFTGYGVLEDAHFALRAGRDWRLLENGSAHCTHLRSQTSRVDTRRFARMSATNYRYVFVDLVPRRSLTHEIRFWRVQLVDLLTFLAVLARRPNRDSWGSVRGKVEGMVSAWRLKSAGDPLDEV